jgi:hypothetical protein
MPHHALRCGAYAVELRSLSALAPQIMGAASRAQPVLRLRGSPVLGSMREAASEIFFIMVPPS